MCSIFYPKSCDDRTLGEKCMLFLTIVALIAFIITCITFGICTYEEEMPSFGFSNDDMSEGGSGVNWTRIQSELEGLERNSAALMIFEKNEMQFVCNLNIISKKWLLTTAHCINQVNNTRSIPNLSVKAAIQNYKDSGMSRKVEKLVTHPNFTTHIYYNNIGLVKVIYELDINYGKYPYDLLYSKPISFRKNDVVNVFGWGKNNYDDVTSTEVFKTMQFYLIDRQQCLKITKKVNKMMPSDICGYQYHSESGICHPSDGAGILKDGQLMAISSWGERCIGNGLPHVFITIEPHIDWILSHVLPRE